MRATSIFRVNQPVFFGDEILFVKFFGGKIGIDQYIIVQNTVSMIGSFYSNILFQFHIEAINMCFIAFYSIFITPVYILIVLNEMDILSPF